MSLQIWKAYNDISEGWLGLMERTKEDDGACDIDHDHIATERRHLNQVDTCTQC